MKILGIETSCDDTGVAIYADPQGVRVQLIQSQLTHAAYGGVVPELASRDHLSALLPLIETAIQQAGKPDAIAYTRGPGLAASLWIGSAVAHTCAWRWRCPLIPVHHLEGHLFSPFISKTPTFPFVGLIVSGGHTQLWHVKGLGIYELLGQTRDDAAGEAFDKGALCLGLSYPGGAALAALAEAGEAGKVLLPRPLLHQGLAFSFSGLKTALRAVIVEGMTDQDRANVARALQEAIVETLVTKALRALDQTGLNVLVVAGGVSANTYLRACITKAMAARQGACLLPSLAWTTDNGAMIAYVGWLRAQQGETGSSLEMNIEPRWPLEHLTALPQPQ